MQTETANKIYYYL